MLKQTKAEIAVLGKFHYYWLSAKTGDIYSGI